MPTTGSSKKITLVFSGGFCGGAEVLMIKLDTLFKSKGLDSELILAGSGELSKRFENAASTIKAPELFDKWKPWRYLKALFTAISKLKKSKTKLVLVEGKALTQIYVVAARLLGIPSISYVHFPPSSYEVKRIPYGMASKLVLCTKGIASYFSEKQQAKLIAIRNFVNSDHFRPCNSNEQRQALRQQIFQLSASDEETLCLSLVGHLSEVKGQALLLEAAAKLKKTGIPLKICFAGIDNSKEKKHEKKLQNLTQKLGLDAEVLFLGKKKDTRDLYQSSDIFILPSYKEGLPLVVLEAMACGIAVIASNIDGNPEAIEDGISGRLIPAGNSEHLASTIMELHANPLIREDLAKNARERITKHFNEAQWEESFLKLSSELTKN